MSPCPRCGAPGLHETVMLRFDTPEVVKVGHLCPDSSCGKAWWEDARDPVAVLAKAGLRQMARRQCEGRLTTRVAAQGIVFARPGDRCSLGATHGRFCAHHVNQEGEGATGLLCRDCGVHHTVARCPLRSQGDEEC